MDSAVDKLINWEFSILDLGHWQIENWDFSIMDLGIEKLRKHTIIDLGALADWELSGFSKMNFVLGFIMLRTEVRGDFSIHGTKYFQDALFHQKSNIYGVVSLSYLWLSIIPILYMKYWHGWLLLKTAENACKQLFSNNQPCQYFM